MGNAKNTEWQHVTFADIAESITERVDDPKEAGVEVYVGLEHLDSNTTRISRFGTPDDVEASKLRFFPGDVIYARRRAYQRKLGVAEVEGICSAHALVLRARPDVCLPEFLPYFLQSDQFHERALEISVGSLSPTINWKTLRVQEFVLPPVEEQVRITRLLQVFDELGESLTLVMKLGIISRNALVNDSLVNVDQTQMTTLGSVARWFSGGTPRASNRSYYESGTIPWAVIGDIQGGTISETANSITQSGLEAIGGRLAGVGSIIVSMYGTVGKSALVTSPIATNQAIAWGEPDLTKIRPDFLLAVLESKEQELITRARGATQQNINREIIRSVEFPLPKLEFQDQVCAQLQAIREVTETAKVNLSALRSLRAHALTALVSGIEGV